MVPQSELGCKEYLSDLWDWQQTFIKKYNYIHTYIYEILVTGTSIYVNEMLLLEFIAGPSP